MSGKAWPAALRRELGMTDDSTVAKARDDDSIHQYPASSSSLSTSQLRQFIHQSYDTISSLQRQLHRGEESYFEESNAHGNLYSGWDNIWVEENENDKAQKSAPMKKMPNEYRWFSSSCGVNPRGNGKIEAILARESLMEPPATTSNKASASRVLKRACPLKVSSSSSLKISDAINEKSVNDTSEPVMKKSKLDTKPDATVSSATAVAATKTDEALPSTIVASTETALYKDSQLSISSQSANGMKPDVIVSKSPPNSETDVEPEADQNILTSEIKVDPVSPSTTHASASCNDHVLAVKKTPTPIDTDIQAAAEKDITDIDVDKAQTSNIEFHVCTDITEMDVKPKPSQADMVSTEMSTDPPKHQHESKSASPVALDPNEDIDHSIIGVTKEPAAAKAIVPVDSQSLTCQPESQLHHHQTVSSQIVESHDREAKIETPVVADENQTHLVSAGPWDSKKTNFVDRLEETKTTPHLDDTKSTNNPNTISESTETACRRTAKRTSSRVRKSAH